MRRTNQFIYALVALFGFAMPVCGVTAEFIDVGARRQIRWSSRTVKVAFSNSLNNPGANFKLGSDVAGAAERALARWSSVTNIKFEVVESNVQSISSGNSGDGISIITVADTLANNAIFSGGSMTGRTRVFYDEETGEITEADIAINPHPVAADGRPVQFSTDGSAGTYDLEATITHELGHLLGLGHSTVIASTMNAMQALNGLYGKRAFTERTLSEEDRAQIRNLYGSAESVRTVAGRILRAGTQTPLVGVPVWVEDTLTGRIMASTFTAAGGTYRIESLPRASYRVVTMHALSTQPPQPAFAKLSRTLLGISEPDNETEDNDLRQGEVETVNLQALSGSRYLNPRMAGSNNQLSNAPILAEAGKTLRVHIAGEGVDQVPANGITITSPYFRVLAESLTIDSFDSSFPVISFDVSVSPSVPFGDYSIRLQARSSDVAFLPGVITVDPGVETAQGNPTDAPQFFVRQLYSDVLGREADDAGLEYWIKELELCGQDQACQSSRRLSVAAAFFSEPEFQRRGLFIFQLYRAALGRRPWFSEFMANRRAFADYGPRSEENRARLAFAMIESAEFKKIYPAEMSPLEFVTRLVTNLAQTANVDLKQDVPDLLARFDGSSTGRAVVLRRIAESDELFRAERDRGFVAMQYFSYFQRDPDEEGYNFWVNAISSKDPNDPTRYRSIICPFINSAEYQSRFGPTLTRQQNECP